MSVYDRVGSRLCLEGEVVDARSPVDGQVSVPKDRQVAVAATDDNDVTSQLPWLRM